MQRRQMEHKRQKIQEACRLAEIEKESLPIKTSVEIVSKTSDAAKARETYRASDQPGMGRIFGRIKFRPLHRTHSFLVQQWVEEIAPQAT